jgi:hypothetical protein
MLITNKKYQNHGYKEQNNFGSIKILDFHLRFEGLNFIVTTSS